MERRDFMRTALGATIGGSLLGLAGARALGAAAPALGQAALPTMTVYKSPSCGCCGKWIEHIEANGIAVEVKDMDDLGAIKQQYKVTSALQSCHTAVIEGYVIEGHVPASDIKRLLATKPKVVGLTIPGMPQSAPGMDLTPFKPYEVLSFDAKGSAKVFAKHTK
jgi:hypothetical protein